MKIIYTSFLLCLFFISPIATSATSGACSYHGGVDCAAGLSSSGNVICSDGWVSSTGYFDTDECSTKRVYCMAPFVAGCTQQRQVDGLKSQLITSGTYRYAPTMAEGEIQACQDEVNQYQAELSAYNSCVNSQSTQTYQPTLPPVVDPVIVARDACMKTSGPRAKLNSSQTCICQDNYMLDEKQWCVPAGDLCLREYGEGSIPATYKDCSCAHGYHLENGRHCAPDPKPIRFISANVKKWVDDNYAYNISCASNQSFTKEELSICGDYQNTFTRRKYDWQLSGAIIMPTVATATATTPTSSVKLPIQKIETSTKATTTDFVHTGGTDYDAILRGRSLYKPTVSEPITSTEQLDVYFVNDTKTSAPHPASSTEIIARETTERTPSRNIFVRYLNWSSKVGARLWGLFDWGSEVYDIKE